MVTVYKTKSEATHSLLFATNTQQTWTFLEETLFKEKVLSLYIFWGEK
jgi:hypothetical protein